MGGHQTDEADIVIIGGGTAGCVLANRLSADPSVSVILLEAGEDRSEDARVYTPARSGELWGDEQVDWNFESEPEPGLSFHAGAPPDKSALANPDGTGRTMTHPRGKALGGSSAINSFALINPSAAEFDAWAELGNEGWDWNGTKKYLRAFQTIVPPDENVVEALNLSHNFTAGGGSGPVQATFPLTPTPRHQAWLNAFNARGIENINDPLEGQAIGGGITSNHIDAKKRERCHSGIAYLAPVRDRSNLSIITGAMVHKIVFDQAASSSNAVARCVVYEKAGKTCQVGVRRELILAAGAFGSPQLLEISGIGNPAILKKHDIKIVYGNAAVGENLQDHIRAGIMFEGTKDADGTEPPLSREEAEKLYVDSRTGPWAELAAYMFAYMPLTQLSSPADMKQLEAACQRSIDLANKNASPLEHKHHAFVNRTLLSPNEASATAYLVRKLLAPIDEPKLATGKCITFCAMLSHPLSKGHVHIRSPSANTKPAVTFNYYTHPLDLEAHSRHLLALQTLAKEPAFKGIIKADGARYPPEFDLDAAKKYLQETATTNYHPCGTCAMLPEDIGGVVDPRLKVYGTANVRVVDASVFPIIPRGNIVSVVYAVAEKAADILREDLASLRAE